MAADCYRVRVAALVRGFRTNPRSGAASVIVQGTMEFTLTTNPGVRGWPGHSAVRNGNVTKAQFRAEPVCLCAR